MNQETQIVSFQFQTTTLLLIIAAAIFSTSLSEFISWLMLYRKDDYKQTKSEVEKQNKKLQKLKSTHVIQTQSKAHEKKIASVEAQLKSISQQMTFQSMKSNLIVAVLMIGVINYIGTYFSGIIVAILPFEPFSLIRGITHRNLQGENYYQCAYLFIYILFAFIWRSNLKKALGFQPPKPAVSFFEPPKYKPE